MEGGKSITTSGAAIFFSNFYQNIFGYFDPKKISVDNESNKIGATCPIFLLKQNHWSGEVVPDQVRNRGFVLARPSVRSSQEIFIFMIKTICTRPKYPENSLIHFDCRITGLLPIGMHCFLCIVSENI